jgi:hypothetical protein
VERVDEATTGAPAIPPRQPPSPRSEEPPPRRSAGDPEGAPARRPGTDDTAPAAATTTAAVAAPSTPTTEATPTSKPDTPKSPSPKPGRVRARKVRRVVRHIEPWSVLKISLLFYAALFLIICVASVLLWGVARASGTVDNVESFITSVGGFGNCEPINGEAPVTSTTLPGAESTAPVDQLDPTGASTTLPEDLGSAAAPAPGEDEDCRAGEELVGEFKFEDARIFQAFALGGIVLVLAGSAANVVLVLLFNLMSDLTGGVRVTVLEEEPPARAAGSGSPTGRRRD